VMVAIEPSVRDWHWPDVLRYRVVAEHGVGVLEGEYVARFLAGSPAGVASYEIEEDD